MRKVFFVGVLATLVGVALLAVVVISSGIVDIAATEERPLLDRILSFASFRAIRHHARNLKSPVAGEPAALKAGLEHYREMCVACHGGPGAEPEKFAGGMHPSPPDLASPEAQSFTDGMLYDSIARGIGSTGMPAFERIYEPRDIWSIVAFVRHLSNLSADEKKELAARGERAVEARPSTKAAEPRVSDNQRVHRISINNFKYSPASLQVHQGDVVVWLNNDFVAHTATADDKSFDTGKIDANESKEVVAEKKGGFPYFCRFHNSMRGTLIVE